MVAVLRVILKTKMNVSNSTSIYERIVHSLSWRPFLGVAQQDFSWQIDVLLIATVVN